MDSSQITQTIIDTINTIVEQLFSSIDNQLYSVLDEITFIGPSILEDNNFKNIFGLNSSSGILLIANSLLLGFLLYFAIKYLLSHLTYSSTESPKQFIFKLLLCGICMNFSFFLIEQFLELSYNITLAIQNIGINLFNKNISFSELINTINNKISIDSSSINIFSIDGLIKGTLTLSLLNLVLSYSFRYIIIKVFILIFPFAILSLSLQTSAWFFKSCIKNLFSLIFIQFFVSFVLLLLFSIDYNSSEIFIKFIYVGGIYALIRANTVVRSFIGGISTMISSNFSTFKKF